MLGCGSNCQFVSQKDCAHVNLSLSKCCYFNYRLFIVEELIGNVLKATWLHDQDTFSLWTKMTQTANDPSAPSLPSSSLLSPLEWVLVGGYRKAADEGRGRGSRFLSGICGL